MSLDVIELHDAVLALLRTASNMNVFDGSVDDAGQGSVQMDPDGRAHMYSVLYTSPGWLTSDRASSAPSTLMMSFQVTAAGGDANRALRAALKVRAILTGARLTTTSGLIKESTDPGPVREDSAVIPSRWYTPILFDVYNV